MYVYVCIVLLNSTVYDHLKGLGLSSKLDVWIPHVLTERNLCRRIDVCDSLLKRHENDPFLKRIITGDEKRVVYNNVKRKRSWSKKDEPAQTISKADIHQKKVMLSVWWDFKGIVFTLSNVKRGGKYWNRSRNKLDFKGSSGKEYGTDGLN